MTDDDAQGLKQSVLIVEDNDDNLLIYSAILEYSGFRVLSAKDGPTGLRLAKEQAPDIILMDVSVPGMDGWQVTRLLKDDPATRGIPIIVLTAHALATDRERAFAAGADGYIAKPADPKAVLRAVQRRLADPTYVIGQIGPAIA